MLPGVVRAVLLPRWGARAGLPRVRLRVAALACDPVKLAAYRDVVGIPGSELLPLTYPQVLAAPLHAALMARPDFPHSPLGVVHLRNEVEQRAPVPVRAAFTLAAWFQAEREVPAGREMDLVTELELGGAVAWRATTTMLRRTGSHRPARQPPSAGADRFADAPSRRWVVARDIGRRYARVSGDVNPIHLSALTARLFGYRRAIAHGMWTLARCLGELGAAAPEGRAQLSCRFQRPLFLGSEALFQARESDGATEFRVSALDGTPHLSGRLVVWGS